MSSLRFDASDLEKGEKGSTGPSSAPAASTRSAASADVEDTQPAVTDPRKTRLVNIGIVVFCAVAILIFAGVAYSIFGAGGSFWEAFGCTAVAFLLCAAAVGTVLFLRKDIVSILAESSSP